MSKTPCLVASAAFALAGGLIPYLAVGGPGAADMLGLAACAAAAGAAAALAYGARPSAASGDLSRVVEEAVERALKAAEARREAAILRAAADAPAPTLDAGEVESPAGKTRLGRGLAGLIQGTSVKSASAPAAE